MSELKEHRFIGTDELFHDANAGALYYEKSEADREIRKLKRLKERIAELERMDTEHTVHIAKMNARIAQLEKEYYIADEADREIRKQKRKRCLALAEWCDSESYVARWYHDNIDLCRWFEKWQKRWLAIAEKFKPNNSTAQKGKG